MADQDDHNEVMEIKDDVSDQEHHGEAMDTKEEEEEEEEDTKEEEEEEETEEQVKQDDSSKIIHKLENELKQAKITIEEQQTRIGSLEFAQSSIAGSTVVAKLYEEFETTKVKLDNAQLELSTLKEELATSNHRLSCSLEREDENIGRLGEAWRTEAQLKLAAQVVGWEMEKKDETIAELEAKIVRLDQQIVKFLVKYGTEDY